MSEYFARKQRVYWYCSAPKVLIMKAMSYGIEKGNFTSLCKRNFVLSPHNTRIIPFCRKLPEGLLQYLGSESRKQVWSHYE